MGKRATSNKTQTEESSGAAKYPRHSISEALRIPKAILEQNAGKACTIEEAATFIGVGASGPFKVEVSSATKYGFLDRPSTGKIQPSERAKKILRPQSENDELQGFREALLSAPELSEVYQHYRGENLPDSKFFDNTLVETFGVPKNKIEEFKEIFLDSLTTTQLISKSGDKTRLIDITKEETPTEDKSERIKKLGKSVKIDATDSCFVMQPFAKPLGGYYEKIYKPAIEKAGLIAVRADADIFGTGKIVDQVLRGIRGAKVLVAELTSRNPNVFYELGIAHAILKPVVLVSSNENDVPFDLQHIRVIYYDVNDPFWGQKLIDKVAENILSAIKNPEEAIFKFETT